MKIRASMPRRISLLSTCVFLFFFCFCVGQILLFAGVDWVEHAHTYTKLEYLVPSAAIWYVAALGFLAIAFFLRVHTFRISFYMFMAVCIMIFVGGAWIIPALENHTLKDTMFAPATPMFWLCACFIFVGYVDEIWELIKKLLFPVACLFLLLTLMELINFHIMVGGIIQAKRIGASAPLTYFQNALWLFAIYLSISDEGILKHGKIVLGSSVLLALMSILFRSRSLIVQTLILLL